MMNLLKLHTPSLNRIYGDRFNMLRESCQTLMMALDNIRPLLDRTEEHSVSTLSALNVLVGAMYRHFAKEVEHMYNLRYEDVETHIDKHNKFVELVEAFSINFMYNSAQQNLQAYNCLQRWLSIHLLMDDAHFTKQVQTVM